MQVPNISTLARLDRLTLAIGENDFGECLLESMQAITDADCVMAFAFFPELSPRVIVSKGREGQAAIVEHAAAYAASLYLVDPNYALIRQARREPVWVDYQIGQSANHFDEAFLDKLGARDIYGFAARRDDVVYYVMIVRTDGPAFLTTQKWMLGQIGELTLANLHKHFSYMHALRGKNEFVMARVLAEASAFATLTPRERVVCLGILTGYTSESIGINLSISVNSVLTYRKRLYEKLHISSQNELFMQMIGAMIDLSRDDIPIGGATRRLSRPLEEEVNGEAERFNEYYMAEAFVCEDPT